MNLPQPVPIAAIAEMINAKVLGNQALEITSVNEIHKVQEGSITFAGVEKYFNRAIYSAASAIILTKEVAFPPHKALLIVEHPFDAYNKLALHFSPSAPLEKAIDDSAVIGEDTVLEQHVVLGRFVKIGRNCLIRSNVVIGDYTEIGDNVIIHPNCSIGNDAFYYEKKADGYHKWHTIGRVLIMNNVEIGACCTIDRGVSGDTIIDEGTKIDNQVHIAHGVVIGKHCLIAAQVGIAGKSHIQDHVVLYGQVGVSKDLVIGEGAVVFAQSGVSKSLPGGKSYFGSPAAENRERLRELAALRRLPEVLGEWDTQ